MADKKPIIAFGESYSEQFEKSGSGGNKKRPHEYEEARENILNNINYIRESIETKREIFLDEKILCIRMEPDFEAKSYIPNSFIYKIDNTDIIGGRKFVIDDNNKSKLYFLRTDIQGINNLYDVVKNNKEYNNKSWVNEICSIRSLDLLKPEEKIMGFRSDWKYGNIEIVLHPLNKEYNNMIDTFYKIIDIPKNKMKIRHYDNSYTFISLNCSTEHIEKIKRYNPLRSIHPLGDIKIINSNVSSNMNINSISLLEDNKKSEILVGVFDGGIDENNRLLKNYSTAYNPLGETDNDVYMQHGTAVCGAILFGNFDNTQNPLSVPVVSIESYRVLPPNDKTDIELYETIDIIEKVVKENTNIKLFNISFGPDGAIIDDDISRFTYSLDKLSYGDSKNNKNFINPLFVVAVGNDGDKEEPFNRIQSPSDMVNGLGIGAYTYINNQKERAEYSCIGPGREGGKVKPDFLEFGGSSEKPFLLLDSHSDNLLETYGTSFAAPLVVNKIGKLIASSDYITPHLARALLIHNAENNKNDNKYYGHGFNIDNVENILECEDNKVTILYSGYILSGKTIKLPIFAPNITLSEGKANITWTIATVVDTYANDTDAYTSNCIEDTFYPHSYKYKFTNGNNKSKTCDIRNVEEAEQLIINGYRQSSVPISESSPKKKESELKNRELKWDTVIKKQKSKLCQNICDPFLTLHAIGRNYSKLEVIKYFAIINIEIEKYDGSLYNNILQKYNNLRAIEIRNIERIMVNIKQ